MDNPYILDKGEEYSFSGTFEECGFESTQFLSNTSFMLWCYALNFAFFIIYLLVKAFNWLTGCMGSVRAKLQKYFVYNGPLRLFAETFFNLYLAALLNIIALDEEESEEEEIETNTA